jgi:hypothetical protein
MHLSRDVTLTSLFPSWLCHHLHLSRDITSCLAVVPSAHTSFQGCNIGLAMRDITSCLAVVLSAHAFFQGCNIDLAVSLLAPPPSTSFKGYNIAPRRCPFSSCIFPGMKHRLRYFPPTSAPCIFFKGYNIGLHTSLEGAIWASPLSPPSCSALRISFKGCNISLAVVPSLNSLAVSLFLPSSGILHLSGNTTSTYRLMQYSLAILLPLS